MSLLDQYVRGSHLAAVRGNRLNFKTRHSAIRSGIRRSSWVLVMLAMLATILPLSPAQADDPPIPKLPVDFPNPMEKAESPSVELPPPPVENPVATNPPIVNPPDNVPVQLPAGTEIVDRRTATSKTFATQDPMQFKSTFYSGPVHYQDAQGKWQEIETNLEPALGGVFSSRANSFQLQVTNGLDLGPIAKISLSPLQSFAFGLEGALLSPATPIGDKILYPGIKPGVDIELQSLATGLKETIILRSASAPRSYLFPLELSGMRPELQDNGDIVYVGTDGQILGRTPRGFMHDSNVDEQSDEPQYSDGVQYELVWTSVSSVALRVTVDDTWLSSPDRVYPVYVDPTWVYNGQGDDTWVQSCCNADYSGQGELRSGSYNGGGDKARSFIHFDFSNINNKNINWANFWGYETWSYSCNARWVYLYRVSQGWAGSTMRTFPGASVADVIGSANAAAGYETGGCGDAWIGFGIGGAVYNWTHNLWPNYGIAIIAQNESDTYGWKKWASVQSGAVPHVDVDWSEPNTAPYAPDSPNPVGWATVTSQPPTLNARFSDPDGNNGYVHFRLYNSADQVISEGDSGWVCNGCTASWTAPTLTNGDYSWDAYSSDGSLNSGWNGRWYFKMGQPPTVTKTVPSGQSTFTRGDVITYDIKVTNPQSVSMAISSVTDTFPSTLSPVGTKITYKDGTGSPVTCSANSTPTKCTLNAGTLTVSAASGSTAFTLAANSYRTFTLSTVAIGLDRECTSVTNSASAVNAWSTGTGSIAVNVCDVGLGLEKWWSYVSRNTGPQGSASVNAASGNLVVQQLDSTPIQAHGRFSHVLRRTYNSQDSTVATLPGSFGAGWQLNIGQADDLLGDGIGANGLYVPSAASLAQPLSLTLVDRDGTRHVFQLKLPGLTSPIDVAALTSTSLMGSLIPSTLKPEDAVNQRLCIDQVYSPPPGVQMGLWRYIQVGVNNPCTATSGSEVKVIGYAAVRPDRVRYEFDALGKTRSMIDGSGVEFRYLYDTSNRIEWIYEPRSCASGPQTDSSCRSFHFTYPSSTRTDVTDPAGRITTYTFDTAAPKHLTKVENKDKDGIKLSEVSYAYGGASCTGAAANQLCSIVDPRGNATRFTYSSNPSAGGLPRIATVIDRRGKTTTLSYPSATYTTADMDGKRVRFMNIDASGRVGEVDEGSTADSYQRVALYTWDSPGATCRQPDNRVDNNLCRVVRRSLTSTPDEDTYFLYNPEGKLLRERRVGTRSFDTTYGYRAQYVQGSGTPIIHTDTVSGVGNISSTGPTRGDATTLFFISDRTQMLPPRGNDTGASFSIFLTAYTVDGLQTANPNATPTSGTTCAAGTATGNTGLVCQTQGPGFDDGTTTATATIARYTYDAFGQRLTWATPKAIAETSAATYNYTYFGDAERDLTGSVSAGGWLKGITDPLGNFVAFGYDRAGNVVRSWDRNATKGLALSAFPGTEAAAPSSAYVEKVFGPSDAKFAKPWRYLKEQRDQVGNRTLFAVDSNGNVIKVTSPRNNDTLQTFDANDNLLTVLTPEAAGATTSRTYDDYNNPTSTTDSLGKVTTLSYDNANRMISKKWTRGAWPADTSTVPSACRQSSASDAPVPTGRILCQSSAAYDGVDNVTSSTDGNGQTSNYTFDAIHRETRRDAPRFDGTHTTVRTDTLYDSDGNVTDVCPPREFTEGSGTCTSTGVYSTHYAYYRNGPVKTQTSYRTYSGQPTQTLTTSFNYDADGNVVSQTDPRGNASTPKYSTTFSFDLLDRRTSASVPRDVVTSNRTTWNYDSSGNVTSVIAADNSIKSYSYDAAHRLIDSVVGASSPDASIAGTPDVTGGANTRTRQVYDADGNVVAVYDPRAFAASTVAPDSKYMAAYEYDREGRLTSQYIPRFDSLEVADTGISTTQSAECATTIRPTSAAIPAYASGVGVCKTSFSYDSSGNRTRVTMPTSPGGAGRYLAFSYTDDRLVESIDSPSPASPGARVSTSYLYDGLGRQVKQTAPLGRQETTSYFSDGLVKQDVEQPNGSLTHVTTYAYDAAGNLKSETEPAGPENRRYYFSDGSVRESLDGLNNRTQYLYDLNGNPSEVKSPSAVALSANNTSGTPTRNTFSFDNLLLTSTVPISSSGSVTRKWTYGYDASGRKTSQQATVQGASVSGGSTQNFTYFPNGRVSAEIGLYSISNYTKHYTYDAAGNRTKVGQTEGTGYESSSLSATYYLDGLLRTIDSVPQLNSSFYSYNGSGMRVARADAPTSSPTTKTTTNYTYNDAGLPATMTSSLMSGSASWTYDAAGRLDIETAAGGAQTSDYNFNPDDTLAGLTITNSSGTSNFYYGYDQNKRITNQQFWGPGAGGATPVTGSFLYGYDWAGRLGSFAEDGKGTRYLTWDPDGNRLSFGANTYTYNADDSIATETTTGITRSMSYDASGRLTADGCKDYSYDGFDRLWTSGPLALPGAGCAPAADSFNEYDPIDRQIKHANGGSLNSSDVFDGFDDQTVSTKPTATTTRSNFVLEPSGTAKAVVNGANKQFLAEDGQGSLGLLTSSSGATACTSRYDPFGNPEGSGPCNTGSSPYSDLFFRLGKRDANTGTYQMGSRTYDPNKAAFLTPDTYRATSGDEDLSVGTDPLTMNRYSYVNGDPVNLIDPDGHAACNPLKSECRKRMGNFLERHKKTILKTAIIVGAVVAATALCTTGVGCVAGAALVGAVAGGAVGAVDCKKKQSMAGCVVKGAAVGAVGGAVIAIAAPGGAAAAGIGGLMRAVGGGAASGLASEGMSQLIDGQFDGGALAASVGTGALTAGLLHGLGSGLSRLRLRGLSRGSASPAPDFPGPEAQAKIPSDWGPGQPAAKGGGRRWIPDKGNYLRMDPGDPAHLDPLQQVDHVHATSNGKVVADHVPLTDWLKWSSWDRP